MTVVPPTPPTQPPTRAERERADRLAREAQALRDNLYRRKQQSRLRRDASAAPDASPSAQPDAPDDC